jgi:hypothetical protein
MFSFVVKLCMTLILVFLVFDIFIPSFTIYTEFLKFVIEMCMYGKISSLSTTFQSNGLFSNHILLIQIFMGTI